MSPVPYVGRSAMHALVSIKPSWLQSRPSLPFERSRGIAAIAAQQVPEVPAVPVLFRRIARSRVGKSLKGTTR